MVKAYKTKRVRKEVDPRESVVNNAPKLHDDFDIGQVSHQGDLTFVRIERLPSSAQKHAGKQLAEGDTQGSRHIAERGEVYDADPREISDLIERATAKQIRAQYGVRVDPKYLGIVYVSPEVPTENDISHPEHGNQGFPCRSVEAVVVQRNLDSEEREARVAD